MAVSYPGTAARAYSQNVDHSVGLATRYIEQNLDRNVTWDESRAWLEAQPSNTRGTPADWLLLAVLDLEWTGAIQYDRNFFRRPGLPTDAHFAPLGGSGAGGPRARLAPSERRQTQPDDPPVLPRARRTLPPLRRLLGYA